MKTDHLTQSMLNRLFAGREIIMRGRGITQSRSWTLRKNNPEVAEWMMNCYKGELPASAMWELHWPRHHDTRHLSCPVLVHPMATVAKQRDNEFALPDEPENCSCTLAWMLAYATRLRPLPAAVHLCGCDYLLPEGDPEHPRLNLERPSVEYWIGYLRALRVPVHIPDESNLCRAGGYR